MAQQMQDAKEYKVSFGRAARTLLYEDAVGILRFVFDVTPNNDQSEKRWTLHLSPATAPDGIKPTSQAERERISIALERVQEYASVVPTVFKTRRHFIRFPPFRFAASPNNTLEMLLSSVYFCLRERAVGVDQ